MTDAINPSHYKAGWSDDAELISVTENLTGNGAQAVQYVARSTRLDKSLNKSGTIDGQIEDLNKAVWFINREIQRLRAGSEKPASGGRILPGGGMGFINVNPINLGPAVCDIMVHQDYQGKPITNMEKLNQAQQSRAVKSGR